MRIVILVALLASATTASADLPQPLHDAPATSSTLPIPTTDLVFEGTTAEKRISGRFGVVWADRLLGDIKLSAPVSDSGDPVTPASIDGLSAGTSAEVSLAVLSWKPSGDSLAQARVCAKSWSRDREKAIEEARRKQADYKPPSFACSVTSLPPAMADAFRAKDEAERAEMCIEYRETLANEELAKLNKQLADLENSDPARAPDGKPRPCVRSALLPDQQAEFDAVTDYGTPLIYGVRFKADRKDFKYYDPTTLASNKRKGINVSAGAYFGIIVDGVGTLSGLLRYERSYKEGNKATICVPGTVTGALLCNELAKGMPSASSKAIVAISFQKTIFGHLGIVARAAADAANGQALFELPVYFVQPKNSSFTGGLVLSATGNISNDTSAMMPSDSKWTTSVLVFLGGRFDVLGANTTWR